MITAYPVSGKRKSYDLCEAFVRGCSGAIATAAVELRPGAAFFYGVDQSNLHLWRQVKVERREFYYCDNSYFDTTRQEYFRVTRGRLQHSGFGSSSGLRFNLLGVPIRPWQHNLGGHVLVCPQSDSFMRDVVGFVGDWPAETIAALRSLTNQEVRVRAWQRDKGALAATLQRDLEGASVLVTWSSAAAVTSVLQGIPVVVSATCAAAPMSSHLFRLREPLLPATRVNWAGLLADNQWAIDEMANGTAWRMLSDA